MGIATSALSGKITNRMLSSEHETIHGEHQNPMLSSEREKNILGKHQNLHPDHGTTDGEHQNPSAHTPPEPQAPPAPPHSFDQTPLSSPALPTQTGDVDQINEEEQASDQTAAAAPPPPPPLPLVRFINRRSSSTALDLEMGGGRDEGRNRLHNRRRETEAELQFLTRWYPCWGYFTALIAICLCFLTPFEVGFLFPTAISWPLMVMDEAISLIGILDYWFEFNLWKNGIIHRKRDYFCVLSALDLTGSVPWIIIYKATSYEILKLFLMARIFRARKAHHFLQELKSWVRTHYVRSISVLLLEIFSVNIFWAHMAGCIAHYLGPDPQRSQINIPSLYFLMLAFSVTGYGDMDPVNELQRVFVIIAAIFTVYLNFYLNAKFSFLLKRMESFGRKEHD